MLTLLVLTPVWTTATYNHHYYYYYYYDDDDYYDYDYGDYD